MAHHPSSEAIKALIRTVPDFPKSGIQFRDITTLLLDPKGFQLCVDAFADRYRSMKIDVIAGVESRGFIIGAPLALALGLPFVPLRKPGNCQPRLFATPTSLSTDRTLLKCTRMPSPAASVCS
eukprot:TRINITY_DN400_c0_g1_i3.p1 TRINITY_DN400_c0_g1~~TRINITY_DN400_c0_g1_i3.p1  ORF type:complete len:140 (+),score=36.82 TRINITY_DN400_c0_g1_i3:54-422(+)